MVFLRNCHSWEFVFFFIKKFTLNNLVKILILKISLFVFECKVRAKRIKFSTTFFTVSNNKQKEDNDVTFEWTKKLHCCLLLFFRPIKHYDIAFLLFTFSNNKQRILTFNDNFLCSRLVIANKYPTLALA